MECSVSEEPKYKRHYIILKPTNNPQAPKKHFDLNIAKGEAVRLAKNNNDEFTIYESCETFKKKEPEVVIESIIHEM